MHKPKFGLFPAKFTFKVRVQNVFARPRVKHFADISLVFHRSALADEQGKVAYLNGNVLQVQMELQRGQQNLDSEKTASAELSRHLSSAVEVCAGSFHVCGFFYLTEFN